MIREQHKTNAQMNFEQLASQLKAGQVITILAMNDWGFPSSFTCKLTKDSSLQSYAQYRNAIKLQFRKKRQRQDRASIFHEGMDFIVFLGEVQVTTDMWSAKSTPDANGTTIQQSKYTSFDDRYMADALNSTGAIPIFQNVASWK